jgi:hypothetical protein
VLLLVPQLLPIERRSAVMIENLGKTTAALEGRSDEEKDVIVLSATTARRDAEKRTGQRIPRMIRVARRNERNAATRAGMKAETGDVKKDERKDVASGLMIVPSLDVQRVKHQFRQRLLILSNSKSPMMHLTRQLLQHLFFIGVG